MNRKQTAIEIIPAHGRPEEIRLLFQEYAAFLGADLTFQHYEEELASLPGRYAPPSGRLFAAYADGALAGCGAFRGLDIQTCEMKRLYVRTGFRGLGLGRKLSERLLCEAEAAGYRRMVLDTLESLQSAVELYHRLGFSEIPAYYENPMDGVLYFEKRLNPQKGALPDIDVSNDQR